MASAMTAGGLGIFIWSLMGRAGVDGEFVADEAVDVPFRRVRRGQPHAFEAEDVRHRNICLADAELCREAVDRCGLDFHFGLLVLGLRVDGGAAEAAREVRVGLVVAKVIEIGGAVDA